MSTRFLTLKVALAIEYSDYTTDNFIFLAKLPKCANKEVSGYDLALLFHKHAVESRRSPEISIKLSFHTKT